MFRIIFLSVLMSVTFTVVGCGRNDVELVHVKGQVLMNGEPLAEAMVVFRPIAGGRPSGCMTDGDGYYELEYLEGTLGALTGRHKVSVTTLIEADPDSSDPLYKIGRREIVPTKYNLETTLEAELLPGQSEEVDFTLESQRS